MNNYNDKNLRYFGLLPDKCIKCKKTDVELDEFKYRIFKKRGNLMWNNLVQTEMKTLKIPICKSCRPEIERLNKYENYYATTKYYILCTLPLSIIYGIFSLENILWLIPFIVFTVGSIILLYFYYIRFAHPSTISKLLNNEQYMLEIRNNLETKVKDGIEILLNKEQTIIYCPKCGAQRTALDDFCNSCGKDLRQLRISKE
jgi:predicted RNA-binding Zn-ribbon protein involved in translation (DUF1610 family)